MTHRERFIRTLKCEPIGGQVPTFELVFFLTMEAFGKVHPSQRHYAQWDQMSRAEQKLHIEDQADIYIRTAKVYGHSAIFIHPNPGGFRWTQELLEAIRRRTGDEYYIMMHGDVTHSIPDGTHLMDFCVQMLEEPEVLHDQSKRWLEDNVKLATQLHEAGHLLDGFALCSDYCFNTNPFFRPDQFDEFIVPWLKRGIDEYRKLGYYSIKHTDGNMMPILKQMADCKPDATGGFSTDAAKYSLDVVIPTELEEKIEEKLRAPLRELLSQDPRPGYAEDGDRVYGFTYGHSEIKFTVENGVLTVRDVKKV